jgi:hypothetical protein
MKTNYELEAIKFAKKYGVKLTVIGDSINKRYFLGDKENREVFTLRLTRNKKQYTFTFGQSIVNGGKTPTMYDVLACLTKYDVGDFDDFCSEFGFSAYEKSSVKIYEAVCKEYKAVQRLFGDIYEELQEIE